jgi:hypothetical protein
MATVNKDFKIKNGLVVEGQTGTINGENILTEGAGDEYILDLIGGETLITSVDSDDFTVTAGELTIAAGSDIARDGDITSAIDALTTADIEEGVTNQYFTTARVDSHLSGGDGITYSQGTISADLGVGLEIVSGQIVVDRPIVDDWYDANGAAEDVQDNLDSHTNASSGVHGLVVGDGNVVGTSAQQTLSNKTIQDPTFLIGGGAGGITIDTTEIAYLDGVTSNIQNQLDDKAPLASPALTGTPTAPTAAPGTNSTQVATTAYADAAVAALVDGAPDLLNTLNELAAALDDNPDVIGDLQDIAAGKQDTLTAGDNIDITGVTISVTGLDTADVAEDASRLYFTNQRALDATSAAYDVAGAAAQALEDAEAYADALTTSDIAEGTNEYFTQARARQSLSAGNAISYNNGTGEIAVDASQLDSDDIEEGSTNQYFTSQRVRDVLVNADKTNITITDNAGTLVITAENGVADSDTDDLTEGTSNLYFTTQRALDAINGSPITPASVTIDGVTKQVAGQRTEISVPQTVTPLSWNVSQGRSAKLLVKTSTASHSEVSEVLLTLDSSNNVAITEYANISTNGPLMSIAPRISTPSGMTYVNIDVTTTENNSTVTVFGTLLA